MHTAIQQAIYSALTGAGFTVHDDVPVSANPESSAGFQYVVIGELDGDPWNTDDSVGGDYLITLEFASRYAGRKELKQQMDLARSTLERTQLDVIGYHFLLCELVSEQVQPVETEDGKTRKGTQQYRVLIDQTG